MTDQSNVPAATRVGLTHSEPGGATPFLA
jgi:hypothetical protein